MGSVDLEDLNFDLKFTPGFIGIFKKFYDDSIYENISKYYINLAYEYRVKEIQDLSIEQHS